MTTTAPTPDDLLTHMRRRPYAQHQRGDLAAAFSISTTTAGKHMEALIERGDVEKVIVKGVQTFKLAGITAPEVFLVPVREVTVWTKPMSTDAADRRRMGAA